MIDSSPPGADSGPEVEPHEKKSTGHPLFPRAMSETGPDNRRFDWIQVVRYLPDGTREVCPKRFRGSELTSWTQITDEFGGDATYQLGAQSEENNQYTAWSPRNYFAGPPRKSFSGGPWLPRQDASPSMPAGPQSQTSMDIANFAPS